MDPTSSAAGAAPDGLASLGEDIRDQCLVAKGWKGPIAIKRLSQSLAHGQGAAGRPDLNGRSRQKGANRKSLLYK